MNELDLNGDLNTLIDYESINRFDLFLGSEPRPIVFVSYYFVNQPN